MIKKTIIITEETVDSVIRALEHTTTVSLKDVPDCSELTEEELIKLSERIKKS